MDMFKSKGTSVFQGVMSKFHLEDDEEVNEDPLRPTLAKKNS